MYTGDPCSFCEAAKALLKAKNVEIQELDIWKDPAKAKEMLQSCLLYTSPSPRDRTRSRMPSSA